MEVVRSPWSIYTKLAVSTLLLILFTYLLFRFSAVIKPLILAALLAYVLTPVAIFWEQRLRLPRPLAALLAYPILLLVLALLPVVLIPTLASQFENLNLDIQHILAQVEAILGRRYVIGGQVLDLELVLQQVGEGLRGAAEPVFGQTLGMVVEVFSSLAWIIFILVVSFYLVKDGPALQRWLEELAPPSYRSDYIHLRGDIAQIWGAFFRGQLVLALVVGTGFSLAGLALGLRFALAMGVLAGILEFLPSIGHGIWLTLASLLALLAGSSWIPIPNWAFMLLIIGLHVVFQQFDLNYLIPRIIGHSVHLSPLVVILGIVTGLLLAGVLGILLAAPVIASARVLARYVYANLFDLDPFPGNAAPPLPAPNPYWWRKTQPVEAANPPQEHQDL